MIAFGGGRKEAWGKNHPFCWFLVLICRFFWLLLNLVVFSPLSGSHLLLLPAYKDLLKKQPAPPRDSHIYIKKCSLFFGPAKCTYKTTVAPCGALAICGSVYILLRSSQLCSTLNWLTVGLKLPLRLLCATACANQRKFFLYWTEAL